MGKVKGRVEKSMSVKRKKEKDLNSSASSAVGCNARAKHASRKAKTGRTHQSTAGSQSCCSVCFRCPRKIPNCLLHADFMTMVLLLCFALVVTSLAMLALSLLFLRGSVFISEVTTVWIPILLRILFIIRSSDFHVLIKFVVKYAGAILLLRVTIARRDDRFLLPTAAFAGMCFAEHGGLIPIITSDVDGAGADTIEEGLSNWVFVLALFGVFFHGALKHIKAARARIARDDD
eukprot:SAG31_NODE_2743_length_5152_cov_2.442905_2_plen_233_part_00